MNSANNKFPYSALKTQNPGFSYLIHHYYISYLTLYIVILQFQVSPDGNVSTTTVIFIPDESDQGKFLSCRAENVQLSSSAVEDQWKLEVHCTSFLK